MKVSAEVARRFLVARHFLAPARSIEGGPDGVLAVLRRLGSIQFDPIAVAGRNHDLMLHARVAGYEPGWCDDLYARRKIFETTNKALSYVPADEFPWYRLGFGRKGPQFHADVLAENPAVAKRVLERIRAEGALSTLEFTPERGAAKDWFGAPENAVRAVLEAYTVMGVIGLQRREGNLRYYDLIERLLPADLLAREVPLMEQVRHKLLSRYRAHGLLGTNGAGGVFWRLAPPPSTPGWAGLNALRADLIDRGSLVPIEVEGVRGKRFVLAEEVALLETAPEPACSVALLPPFDSLLWDTGLLGSLFGFTFVWEGFLAPAKRRWGRYVLPISFGDRFVGRIEPRIDRARGCVEIAGLWWEDGFVPEHADGFVDAMGEALRAYLRFARVDRID
ncbi:MAG TPA: crosslink repair DNA glycosylase YcaQ family protein, partial [Micromonosporaceae bacterium]